MKDHKNDETHDRPPLFKSWKTWYVVVIGNLFLMIVLFYIFSRIYQ